MFSEINLVNSETLGPVWKLAHSIHIGNAEKVNLPNICKEINSLVTSVPVKTNRRLSLRASSNLVCGAAKLYRDSLSKLYDDVIKMDEDLIFRRKRNRLDSSTSESSASTVESTVEDPETMTRCATVGFMNSSFSPTKRIRTEPTLKIAPIRIGTTAKSSTDGSTGNSVEEPFSEEEIPDNQLKNECVQTSPILISRNRKNKDSILEKGNNITGNRGTNISSNHTNQGFDRNLPFGYILIHDNYDSRIPSKIIFTSINSDVNKLI